MEAMARPMCRDPPELTLVTRTGLGTAVLSRRLLSSGGLSFRSRDRSRAAAPGAAARRSQKASQV